MTLSELTHQIESGARPTIEIHSFEPSLYLIFWRDGDRLEPLKDGRGDTLRYYSRSKAIYPLTKTGLSTADFVHQTSFCELIGLEGGARESTEFRETIHLDNVHYL